MTPADRLAEAVSAYITSVPSDEEGTRPPWIRDLIMAYDEYTKRKKPTVEEVARAIFEERYGSGTWAAHKYKTIRARCFHEARAAMRAMGGEL